MAALATSSALLGSAVSLAAVPLQGAADSQGYISRPSDSGNRAPDVAASELGGGTFDNRRLALTALSDVGRRIGSAKYAINEWVRRTSGGAVLLGGSYVRDYLLNGGQAIRRVTLAARGDIVQLWQRNAWNKYARGMHSAVVLRVLSESTLEVVDADWRADGRVRVHRWNPSATARTYGLAYSIWRLGSVRFVPPVPATSGTGTPPPPPSSSAPAPAPAPPAPTPAVTTYAHRVQGTCAEGSCGLRILTAPGGSSAGVIGTVFDGQSVDIVCQVMGESVQGQHATSAVWDRLSNGGYVSDYFLDTANVGAFSPPIPEC